MKMGLGIVVFLGLILILSLTAVSAIYVAGDAIGVDQTCSNIYYCVNYLTSSDCEANLCNVFDNAVPSKITCGQGYICGCYWNNTLNQCNPYWTALFENSTCIPKCEGKECGGDGCDGVCGGCSGGKTCNAFGKCLLLYLKNNGEVCNSDSECKSEVCSYDIFTENNVIGNINTGSSVKYCHSDSSKCLFYAGVENNLGCTRCASWENPALWDSSKGLYNSAACAADPNCNGPWDNFLSTCVEDSNGAANWGEYNDCNGNTPYCIYNFADGCNAICVECGKDSQCPGLSKCINNKCEEIIIPNNKNKKNMNLYSDKEVFLISDKNWEDVLSLIPLTTWTGDESCNKGYGTADNVCVYPTSIYHTEADVVYVDMAQGAIATSSSTDGTHSASLALDSNTKTEWNSGSNGEGYLKLDLKEVKQFNRIDVYEMTEPYFISIYVSQDDISYQEVVGNYVLKKGISFTPVNNVFTFSAVNARYVKFVLTDNPQQNIYPNWKTIAEIKIYGAEKHDYGSFDADSIIYFMQQYSANKVTIAGDTSQELDNLLVALPELGAGVSSSNIKRIGPTEYLNYWSSYKDIVYVEDNYELALVASTYASLIDAPLVIKGTKLDMDSVFDGRNVICVGNVQRECNEQYSLDELQQKYVDITDTDKIILINPDDWNVKLEEEFQPDKSAGKIYQLYSKTSLASPILASAKHEVIVSTKSTNPDEISSFIKGKINELMPWIINNPNGIFMDGSYYAHQFNSYYASYDFFIFGYLTIFGAPNVIPSQEFMYNTGIDQIYIALDQSLYGDISLDDKMPDLSVGRIQGITLSDVSSYVARDLFYDKIGKTDNMLFTAKPLYQSEGGYYSIRNAENWTKEFNKIGYNAQCSIIPESYVSEQGFICSVKEKVSDWSDLYKNEDLITYIDHGTSDGAGILSPDIPYLTNSIILTHACSTCSSYDGRSFCNNVIRKGSLGFMGSVSPSWSADETLSRMTNSLYKDKLSLGQSFSKSYSSGSSSYMVTLIGDPTFNINPTHTLKEGLPWL